MMYKQKSSKRQRLVRAAALAPALTLAVAMFQTAPVPRAITALSEISLSGASPAASASPAPTASVSSGKVTEFSSEHEMAMADSGQKEKTPSHKARTEAKADASDGDVVLNAAYTMPEYPGGMQAMMKYLMENIHFPENPEAAMGCVVVKFVVKSDGKVSDVNILKSVGPEADAEAIRVVKSMPDFTPGRNENGEAVSVHYTLPINFAVEPAVPDAATKSAN